MEDEKITPALSVTTETQDQQEELGKNVFTKDEYELAILGYKQGKIPKNLIPNTSNRTTIN